MRIQGICINNASIIFRQKPKFHVEAMKYSYVMMNDDAKVRDGLITFTSYASLQRQLT